MSSNSAFLEKLRAVVLEHYSDEQFGVSELVDKFGMSRSQIHRKLKAANGKSVSQFIREVRLDEALKLLKENNFTASEVAYMVGFNSSTYFNTCFNEYFGFPPGEARHRQETTEVASEAKEKPARNNKRVLIWMLILTALTVTLFFMKYNDLYGLAAEQISSEQSKSVAVLPFKNWSGNPDLEYVSDGMTDAVIRRLSSITDIDKVVPFTSIITYKNSDKTTDEIAKELGVEYIVEGNFKLSGEDVMSNLNLIEVRTNKFLWSLEYTGKWKTDEIFEMQANVAENVATNMKAEISVEEMKDLNIIPTNDEQAYTDYLRAEFNYERLNPVGFDNAKYFYNKAIERDSSFIDPYLGMAIANFTSGMVWGGQLQSVARSEGNKYLDLAIELNIEQNELYKDKFVKVRVFRDLYYNFDFQAVQKEIDYLYSKLDKGLSNNETGMIFEFSRKIGEFERAEKILLRAIQENDRMASNPPSLAVVYLLEGQPDKAKELLNTYDAVFQDDFFYLMESSKVYFLLKEYKKSKKQLTEFTSRFPMRPPIIIWLSAVNYEIEGKSSLASNKIKQLEEYYFHEESGSPAWFIALYYAQFGEINRAFQWLNRSYERREVEMTWLMQEPILQPLKEDPRYIELYEKMGFDMFQPLTNIEN